MLESSEGIVDVERLWTSIDEARRIVAKRQDTERD